MATSNPNKRDFSEEWDLSDVTFIVEDKKVYANKTVLILSSDVFKIMLTSDFAEKEMEEIPLQDKKFDDFIKLMEVLHPPPKDITGTNVYAVLPLAHEYQIERILQRCHQLLVNAEPSLVHLNIATKYNLHALGKKAIQYAVSADYALLEREDGFKQIDEQDRLEILRAKAMKASGHVKQSCGAQRGAKAATCRTCYFLKCLFSVDDFSYQRVRFQLYTI